MHYRSSVHYLVAVIIFRDCCDIKESCFTIIANSYNLAHFSSLVEILGELSALGTYLEFCGQAAQDYIITPSNWWLFNTIHTHQLFVNNICPETTPSLKLCWSAPTASKFTTLKKEWTFYIKCYVVLFRFLSFVV